MIDYQFRIKVAERELAHLREMQAIQQAHLDAHDCSFEAVGGRLDRIEADLAAAAANLNEVRPALKNLSEIITHEHRNGKTG
ncbi:MAG: hypothetical protein JO061_23580 [Acidobacteriaceae bacterium]|nr:hypothetical protein [Acidobacteriaceae bacterium]